MTLSQQQQQQQQSFLLHQTAADLEVMRCLPATTTTTTSNSSSGQQPEAEFPMAARALLYSLPGNQACVDCGAPHPTWASVSFGTLLCLQCSGKHRSLGVATSFVRSVDMDAWTHRQILSMLEGGNDQWHQFLDRHRLGRHSKRYLTKAAKFYRTHLAIHAQQVATAPGPYPGREAARRQRHDNNNSNNNSNGSHSPQQQQQKSHAQATATAEPQQQPTPSELSASSHHHHHHHEPRQRRIAVAQ